MEGRPCVRHYTEAIEEFGLAGDLDYLMKDSGTLSGRHHGSSAPSEPPKTRLPSGALARLFRRKGQSDS